MMSDEDSKEQGDTISIKVSENDEINFEVSPGEEESTKINHPLESEEISKFSIYVKNVDFSASPEDLAEYFVQCGEVKRVIVLNDKYTGVPKGYAIVEFYSIESKEKALKLNNSLFKNKQIKVEENRKKIPKYFGKKAFIMRHELIPTLSSIRTRSMTNSKNPSSKGNSFKPY